jgi:uncharacterized protein YbjQ (UPF0145 family)
VSPPPPPDSPGDKTWGEYRYFLLEELKRIGRDMEALAKEIHDFRVSELAQIKTEIALLKQKAAAMGAAAVVAVTIVITLIQKFVR